MNTEISFRDKDLLVMKLLHYFITEKEYNPIILKGVNNEIWLENMDAPYKIVRINTGYLHNNEQYNFDMFKTKRIMDKIKLKTFSFSINTLSLFIDLGENVTLNNINNIDCVKITDEKDISSSSIIVDAYPDIKDKLVFDEKGMELFARITNDINKKNMKDAKEADDLFSPKTPIVTYIIMGLCVLMYIVTLIYSKAVPNKLYVLDSFTNALYALGGLSKTLVIDYNQLYRIITCTFLHGSIIHLLSNMYALYVVGKEVESYYGKVNFIIIYIVSGIVGSLTSLIFTNGGISIGASGAIFGLMGALLYFGYHYRVALNNAITKQILPVILLNLVIGFTVSGIDNFAHLGGLLGGVMASMAVGVKYKSTSREKSNGVVVLVLLIGFLIYMLYK